MSIQQGCGNSLIHTCLHEAFGETGNRESLVKGKMVRGWPPPRATLLIMLVLVILLNGCAPPDRVMAQDAPMVVGNPERGREAIRQYGCGSCHVVPGVAGANSYAGPPLTAWARRHYIAGKLPNQPEYLEQWIRYPQAIEPGTAMPNMGVTEQAAEDISAYLYSLEEER